MKKIWSLLSINNFKSGAAWLVFLLGLFFYFIGYKDDPSLSFDKIAIKIADVLVIGALVGFLANAARFLGIFKQDLQDIIYANEFVNKRKDINPIWKNVSKTLFNNKFSTIHEDLLNTILGYFPIETSYYMDYFNINSTITWKDKAKNLIKVVDIVSFELVTESEEKILFPINTWNLMKNDQQDISKIVQITCDDKVIPMVSLPDKK